MDEEQIKTTRVGDLTIPVPQGQSEEMAVLNSLMGDIEGVVDEDTKMDFYKLGI